MQIPTTATNLGSGSQIVGNQQFRQAAEEPEHPHVLGKAQFNAIRPGVNYHFDVFPPAPMLARQ